MADSVVDLAETTQRGATMLFHQRGSADPGQATATHSHPFWQLELISAGRADLTTGSGALACPPGTVALIPPGVVHRFAYRQRGTRWLSIKFSGSDGAGGARRIDGEAATDATALAIDRLIPDAGEPDGDSRNAIGHLLAALLAMTADAPAPAPARPSFQARIVAVIEREPGQAWTVATIARRLHLTPGHASAPKPARA